MVDALKRGGEESLGLIRRGDYWALHAARQSGKTTLLMALVDRINAEGDFYAVYCSLETASVAPKPEQGIPAILSALRSSMKYSRIPALTSGLFAREELSDVTNALKDALTSFCDSLDKPLVILFDEVDSVSDATLISFMRQLRNGYITRNNAPFLHSTALVGMRNIRDFKAHVRPDRETLGSASPFNIIVKAMTLDTFSREDVADLYAQHTADTGQVFEDGVVDLVYEQTRGQPWLVNAIARLIVEEKLRFNYNPPVTKQLVEDAIQGLILRRDTHIDSLLERLREERVRRVIEPLIVGEDGVDRNSDDFFYTRDLGLIREADEEGLKKIVPANPIYAEVMVRYLSENTQAELAQNPDYKLSRYLKGGQVDMDTLLTDFQAFWRENSEIWRKRYEYEEAAPHLVLQAFLQRVINGGGQIIRELALGARRADLCVIYEGHKYPLELKILRGPKTFTEGLKQTAAYMDKLGCTEGWLVVFDPGVEKSWEEKIYRREESAEGKKITVVGA